MEHGGLTTENGQVFRDTNLARGNTVDLATPYHDFRGKDPSLAVVAESWVEVAFPERKRCQK